jgi:hypothetical protein
MALDIQMNRDVSGLRVLGMAALLSAATVPSADAEPITVTSGQLGVAWDDPNFFAFFGPDGFALRGLFFGASSPQQTCFTGCLPGTIVNLSAVAGGGGPGFTVGLSTQAIVNGVDWIGEPGNDFLSLAGTLRFDAPDVVLPPLTDVEGEVSR